MRALSRTALLGLLLVGQGSSCEPRPEEKPDPIDSGEAPLPTEERCDGVDNDLDGEVDEDASDALLWYADSDGDGYGGDAVTARACTAPSGFSAVGGDCADGNAQRHPGAAEVCGGSTDTDCDGLAGCDDADCMSDAACGEDCADGVDNDGDYRADCYDADCKSDPVCTEDCTDGVDNDGDYLADCYDEDCTSDPVCTEDCTDGADDDGDGRADCADADCMYDAACAEDCTDGADNDGDGLVDCEDGACLSDAACTEDCTDGVDDDGDGLADCWDDECWSACGVTVRSHLEGGRLSAEAEFEHGSGWWSADLDGTAWSLHGDVEVVHATGSAICGWTASTAQFWAHEAGTSWSSYLRTSGSHDQSAVVLSSGCPVAWPQVLPPTLSGFSKVMTPSGPWYHGPIAAQKVSSSSGYYFSGGTRILYAVDTLSSANATWSY